MKMNRGPNQNFLPKKSHLKYLTTSNTQVHSYDMVKFHRESNKPLPYFLKLYQSIWKKKHRQINKNHDIQVNGAETWNCT